MLGVLCGLEREAAVARRIAGAEVACAGSRPHLARPLARGLIERGAKTLISFGIAGALDPGLRIGSLVIATEVRTKDGAWACDAGLIEALSRAIPAARVGAVWGAEAVVATAPAKRALYEASGCLIADMESHCAAEVAAEAHIPFATVRAVCDTARMEMPPMVAEAIREDGGVDVLRALTSFLRRPGQIPGLFGLMSGANGAIRALGESVEALGQL